MTDDDLYRLAYNAYESAEAAAMDAMRAKLAEAPLEALACLADPTWGWETRSFLSPSILDHADDLLTQKLDALVEV